MAQGGKAVTSRPILFSGAMVQAILAGKKTQTRRTLAPRIAELDPLLWTPKRPGAWTASDPNDQQEQEVYSPYGEPGDQLWIKETFQSTGDYSAIYRADYAFAPTAEKENGVVWTPSIHMPRWASRITLEVTDVACERLQAMTEADAAAEGVDPARLDALGTAKVFSTLTPRTLFQAVWDTMAKEGSRWADNPWVWRVEFKVLK